MRLYRVQSLLLAGLLLGCSGCCTGLLYESAITKDTLIGVKAACGDNSRLYVTFGMNPDYHSNAQGESYARGSHPDRLKRLRSAMPEALGHSEISVVRVPSRVEAEASAERGSVLWWIETGGKKQHCCILYRGGERTIDARMKMTHKYIPYSKWPVLLVATPLTLTADVLTFPLQAGFFLLIWNIDWTAPYT
jgi:hypothetical protein